MLKPESTGKAYKKIIVMPCIVNSWLYCSGVSRVWSGCASWMRKISASMPPTIRKANAVTM